MIDPAQLPQRNALGAQIFQQLLGRAAVGKAIDIAPAGSQIFHCSIPCAAGLIAALRHKGLFAQAMNDARNDLRNLFMYRQEIMALVSEESDKEDSSDNDVEDIIKAANEMFREKGIKEIEDGEIVRWNLIMEQRRENVAKEIEVQ